MLASSQRLCNVGHGWPLHRVQLLTVRSNARISWVAVRDELAADQTVASRSANQSASATSVLRPGTFLTCAALARIK